MGINAVITPPKEIDSEGHPAADRWNPLTRIAFRFGVVYFGLYCLGIPQVFLAMLGYLGRDLNNGTADWSAGLVEWAGRHIFGVETGSPIGGSGDGTFEWTRLGVYLIIALAAATVWTVLDCRRLTYSALLPWFRILLRLMLAAQMFLYGMAKVFPIQMWVPLDRLVQPLGELSPAGIMWAQVGASTPYEILLGCAEVTGGLLLLLPRTVLPGALLCAVSMGQVFLMDVCFGVPVRLHSFHLLLMALVLVAPDVPRLLAVFGGRAAGPSARRAPLRSPGGGVVMALVVLICGLWTLGYQAWESGTAWRQLDDRSKTVPLYGIWNVEEFSRDGVPQPPLVTDTRRWRRVIFDLPGLVTVSSMDDSRTVYAATVDTDNRMLTLAMPGKPEETVRLRFERPDDSLILDGQGLHMNTTRIDPETFPLKRGDVPWVQNDGTHPLFPSPSRAGA
ncbi:DoxX family protein [Nocardia sp. NPDC051832]|uniref:DoxX family protein n=1 Tax=Nocardia sp. NPDC051832 TaxID=3155673 RepID=UPI00343C7F53